MRRILLSLFVIPIAFGVISCEQDDRDYEVTVFVTTQDSIPVRNATVRIFAPVEESIIDVFRTTNSDGEARFSFDNKAFLEIHAVKGSWKKCDAIELERGMKHFTVNLYPFGDPRRTCFE